MPKDETEMQEVLKRLEEEVWTGIESEKEYYNLISHKINEDLTAFSWKDAAQRCAQLGLNLVSIYSITELKDLIEFLFEYVYEERIPIYTSYVGVHRQVNFNSI